MRQARLGEWFATHCDEGPIVCRNPESVDAVRMILHPIADGDVIVIAETIRTLRRAFDEGDSRALRSAIEAIEYDAAPPAPDHIAALEDLLINDKVPLEAHQYAAVKAALAALEREAK